MRRIRHSALATAGIVALLAACSSDSGTSPADPALIGTWNVTSFQALGQDFIAQGMTMIATFTNAGTYTLDVTNDLTGTCDPGPDCVAMGDYSATATQFTFDPGTVDAVTFSYTIVGTTLTFTGSISGVPVTVTATKQ